MAEVSQFTEINLSFMVEFQYDEVCKHWSWRVAGWEWSDCFDKKDNALSDAQHTLAWKTLHG